MSLKLQLKSKCNDKRMYPTVWIFCAEDEILLILFLIQSKEKKVKCTNSKMDPSESII